MVTPIHHHLGWQSTVSDDDTAKPGVFSPVCGLFLVSLYVIEKELSKYFPLKRAYFGERLNSTTWRQPPQDLSLFSATASAGRVKCGGAAIRVAGWLTRVIAQSAGLRKVQNYQHVAGEINASLFTCWAIFFARFIKSVS